MKKVGCIVCFCIIVLSGFSQNLPHKLISYTNEDYSNNEKLCADYRVYLQKKFDTIQLSGALKKRYTENLATYYEDQLGWASNYLNWGEAKGYLNEIIKTVLGTDWKPNIVAEIRRDADNNAFMIEDGRVYFNVGMLASATSEADLAGTISHEYGHYIKQDHFDMFLKREELEALGEKNSNTKYLDFRVKQEKEADDIALKVMKNSRYDMYALANSFKLFLDEERKTAKEKDYKTRKFKSDHPPTIERLADALKMATKTDSAGRKKYLVDEVAFNKIKKQAIDECVYLNLSEFDFKDNIELCFKQLLNYPDDEFYLFYLNESIRRFITAFPEEADEYFITSFYHLTADFTDKASVPKIILSKKYLSNKNTSELKDLIFYQYRKLLFGNDKKATDALPDSYLTNTDTIEFATYSEALNFFIKRQEILKQSSVNFVKKCMDSTFVFTKINSINTDLNNYNALFEVENKKSKDNICTIIPLDVNYVNTAVSMWKKNADGQSLYSDIIMGLHAYNNIPYEIFDYSKMSIDQKILLYSFLSGLRKCGLNNEDIKYFDTHPKNDRCDVYKHMDYSPVLLNPEIIPVFKKLHLHKIIFSDVWFGEFHGDKYSNGSNNIVVLSNYYVDLEGSNFANSLTLKRGSQYTYSKTTFATDELTELMYQTATNLADDVKNKRENGIYYYHPTGH